MVPKTTRAARHSNVDLPRGSPSRSRKAGSASTPHPVALDTFAADGAKALRAALALPEEPWARRWSEQLHARARPSDPALLERALREPVWRGALNALHNRREVVTHMAQLAALEPPFLNAVRLARRSWSLEPHPFVLRVARGIHPARTEHLVRGALSWLARNDVQAHAHVIATTTVIDVRRDTCAGWTKADEPGLTYLGNELVEGPPHRVLSHGALVYGIAAVLVHEAAHHALGPWHNTLSRPDAQPLRGVPSFVQGHTAMAVLDEAHALLQEATLAPEAIDGGTAPAEAVTAYLQNALDRLHRALDFLTPALAERDLTPEGLAFLAQLRSQVSGNPRMARRSHPAHASGGTATRPR